MRTGETEAQTPKYAHIERERRWLVDPVRRPDLGGLPFTLIEDRYIVNTRLRLRRMDVAGQSALKLTKKYEASDAAARPIVTAYLSEDEYAVFARLPAARIAKRRYHIVDHDREFSLDVFLDDLAPLELVEIEWPDEAGLHALPAPDWTLGEVTHDPRYQGGALATNGLPED